MHKKINWFWSRTVGESQRRPQVRLYISASHFQILTSFYPPVKGIYQLRSPSPNLTCDPGPHAYIKKTPNMVLIYITESRIREMG